MGGLVEQDGLPLTATPDFHMAQEAGEQRRRSDVMIAVTGEIDMLIGFFLLNAACIGM